MFRPDTMNVAEVVYSGTYRTLMITEDSIAAASAPSMTTHQFTRISWISVNGSIL